MYKRILSFFAFVALAAGCMNEHADLQSPGATGYSFDVEVDNPVFVYTEPTKNFITTQDGSISLPLTFKVTEGINVGSPRTKGTQYGILDPIGSFKVSAYDGSSKIIDDKLVKKSSDGWKLEKDPKTWLEGHTLNFLAYANLPEGSSVDDVTSTSQTFSCTIKPTAAEQGDALLGYYSGDGNSQGKATLKFNHPLTAVVFKIGKIVEGDRTETVTGIESVSLKGVFASGTAVANGSGDVLSYNWGSSRSATTTVSEQLTGPEGTSGEAFLLIPQNLSENSVTIEAVLTTASGTKLAQVTLDSGEWKAGKTNTYVLGYTDYISVTGISLNKTATTIKKKDSETLVATISPADADDKTVIWTTSDGAVATVDDAGKVTAVGVGECVITATPRDGVTPATCTVTVTNPVTGISLDKTSLVLAQIGEKSTATLTATVTYYDGTTKVSSSIADCVTWTSSNENVATVDASGVVTAQEDMGSAMATITATTKDKNEGGNSVSTTCTISVPYFSIAPTCFVTSASSASEFKQTIAWSAIGASPVSITFVADNTYGSGSVEIENAATGSIKGNKGGEARVYAVADFGNGITGTSNDCIVNISPAGAEQETFMELSPSEMYLSPLEEGYATANMRYHRSTLWATDKNINWTTSDPGVAIVNSCGIITGIKPGTCTVTATSQFLPTYDNPSGEPVIKTMTVHVNNDAHITLNSTALGLVKGTSFDLTAKVTHSDGSKDSNVSWNSSDADIATVDKSGHVVAVSEGICIITAVSKTEPSLTADCSVTVTSSHIPVEGVSLIQSGGTPGTVVLTPGTSSVGKLTASIVPASATNQNVTWTSSCADVATVVGNGTTCTINAVGVGKAKLRVTTEDGGYYAECTVLVPGVVVPGNSISGTYPNGTATGVYIFGSKEDTAPLYFSVFPSEAEEYVTGAQWTGMDSNIVTVEYNEGSRSTATTKTSTSGATSSASVILTVNTIEGTKNIQSNSVSFSKQYTGSTAAIASISVSPTSVTAKKGEFIAVSAGVGNKLSSSTYGDTNVQWSSTNSEIAVVINDGGTLKIHTLALGECDIKVAAARDLTKTASIHVTVTE